MAHGSIGRLGKRALSALLVSTVLPAALAADPEPLARDASKLIEFGWDEPDTAFLRQHLAEMEATPFDGCVYHVSYKRADGSSGNFTWECWGKKAFTDADLQDALADLQATPFRRFTHNFLRFNTTPADLDWFDDFTAILGNARLAARIAREGKSAGILFDIEQYNAPLFDYAKQRDAKTRPWKEYAEQARRRGGEVMTAFQAAFPDLTIFLTFAYSLPWAQSGGGKKPLAECSYGLLAPFLDGMVEAARGKTRLVDGHELSYGYTRAEEFQAARRRMREELLPIVANPAEYARIASFAFGIWLDHDWRGRGWHTEDFAKNLRTPEATTAVLRAALEAADEYVWLYSETPRWWSSGGGSQKLPRDYFEAVRRARDASPRVVLRDAPLVEFPADTDSNSPAHWSQGTFYLFNSAGHPRRASGPDVFHLGPAEPIAYDTRANGGRWLECTWKDDDGKLYGWYHLEPRGLCPGTSLTAPRIGAVVSIDDGATFRDLGIVLEARPGTLRCDARNGYFAGGHGDFSVMLDPGKEHFYLFFGAYAGDVSEQGVAVARMRYADRDEPVGRVWKWHRGAWTEPGIEGKVSPIFPAAVDWAREDADAFWGPSIHWNTHLSLYVILLNRTKDKPGWPQEGIYVTFNDNLSNPAGWTPPRKIFDGGRWYPQVIGLDTSRRETDKLAGRAARLFMRGPRDRGESRWEILFLRPGEEPAWPGLASPFFAMATGTADAEHATPAAQTALLKELGYAGTDHLGLDGLAEKLKAVDAAGLELFDVYIGVTIDAEPRYEPGLKGALELLRGRETVIWVHLESKGFKPSAPEGQPQAVAAVSEVADLAAAHGLRVALYPHTGSWLERFGDALELVQKAGRKNLGVTFNLCHWLRVEGGGDPRPLLERALPSLFAVTINGADAGGKDWKTLIQTLDRGTFDLRAFLATLDRLGYRGPVGLQGYGLGGSVRDNLKLSMEAWRRLGVQAGTVRSP